MEQKIKQDIQIGRTIRKLRIERKMTQNEIVAKLQLMNISITRSIFSQIENGTYSIRISVLAGLTKILEVDYNTLFRDINITIIENAPEQTSY